MLVLSRKVNEKIQIGENVTITVVRVQGGVIRLGIEAPREISVRRGELPVIDKTSPLSPPTTAKNSTAAADDASRLAPISLQKGPALGMGGSGKLLLETGTAPAARPGAGLRAMVAAIRQISAEPTVGSATGDGLAG